MAGAKFRMERADHTLQPTAIVHEAYLRLKKADRHWESETEFRKYAAPVIRHVLVDHARSRPQAHKVTLAPWEEFIAPADKGQDLDVLALHEVLDRLAERDAGLAKLVELHYFGGLSMEETAAAADLPLGTAKDKLTFARNWLRKELTKLPKS